MALGSYISKITPVHVFIALLSLYSLITLKIFNILYHEQSKPYLDEVFHIPQALRYCNGSFKEWDPKITTLPGLYLLSLGILKPVSWIFQYDLCSIYGLRFINLLCSISNFCIIYSLRSQLCKSEKKPQWKVVFSSLNMAIFPVLYFFTFLYYTDYVSTMLVLLMYRLFNDESYYTTAALGAIAVLCRQTNVVWVGFFALKVGFQCTQNHILTINKKHSVALKWKSFLNSISKKPKIHLPLIKELMIKESGYVFVIVLFLAFIWINRGIVVGDRSAHQAVIHVPQLFYFFLFVLVFSFPYAITLAKKSTRFLYQDQLFMLGVILITFSVIALYTEVHPYLLADNRHYTFYVWKRLYERHWSARYLLAPLYIYGAYCVNNFIAHKKYNFQVAFDVCLIFTLIPQKLLEFRYYILPFLFMRLNMRLEAWWQLILEFLIYFTINYYTINLFITKTFYWEDSEDVQRIMW